jgi:hypothetical protein
MSDGNGKVCVAEKMAHLTVRRTKTKERGKERD